VPNVVTSQEINVGSLDKVFTRADIEFDGLDHSGVSYEGRVFLNNPSATDATPLTDSSYAGSYFIFGHGGCFGDAGHCDVVPRRPFDPRPAHPLTPALKTVIATPVLRRVLTNNTQVTVTVVPIILGTNPQLGRPDDVVKYEQVQIVTYL
jgi:tyrosinase